MKVISLSVSELDYEVFRREAKSRGRSIAQLIRDAMVLYRESEIEGGDRLTFVPVLAGHRQRTPLPARDEIYDEAFGCEDATS